MSANETQVGGDHYKDKAIQPWDYITGNGLAYLEGCIVKYISRHREKGGLEDLHKAKHYLDKLIEVEEAKTPKVSRAQIVAELVPGLNALFGDVQTKKRKTKAPYGLKADGTPYQRKPRNWKG